jgi:hypothetical protein
VSVGGSEEVPRLVESVGGSEEVPRLVESVGGKGLIGGNCGAAQQPTLLGGSANGGAEWAQQVYGGPSQQTATPGGSNLVNMAHVSNCGAVGGMNPAPVQNGGKRSKRGGFGLTEVAVPGVLLAANYMIGRRSDQPSFTRRRRGGSKRRNGSKKSNGSKRRSGSKKRRGSRRR